MLPLSLDGIGRPKTSKQFFLTPCQHRNVGVCAITEPTKVAFSPLLTRTFISNLQPALYTQRPVPNIKSSKYRLDYEVPTGRHVFFIAPVRNGLIV